MNSPNSSNPEAMEVRKLTPEKIDELFVFCRKHYVPEYDLQVELVDHLAAAIEEQWENNPNLLFQDALNKSFGQFGIFGFSKIKDRKEKELQRKYRHLLWKYTFEFFRWPKALLTLALTLILFTLFRIVNNGFWIIIPYFLAISGLVTYYFFRLYPRYFKINVTDGKSFMLLYYMNSKQAFAGIAVHIPINLYLYDHILNYQVFDNQLICFLTSFLIIGLSILLYCNCVIIPQKVREHFSQQFPQFISS